MLTQLRPACILLLGFTLLTGVIYPALVTGLAQAMCPHEANGSIIVAGGKPLGSELIGQGFTDARYFWSRPSAAAPAYNGSGGTGSNQGPSNPALAEAVKSRVAALQAADPGNTAPIPVDLVTASASGLDPHISPAAAEYQLARVARARGMDPSTIARLLADHTESRDLGLFGEPRVNVLELNLALDGKLPHPPQGLTRWGAMGG
jgi:potassium-transporting ATPase KdpC subunit